MLVRYLGSETPSATSRIVAHELLDPTPAIESILHEATGPQWARLREIVAELLGPRATEEDVALASLSVAGQWLFFLYGRRMLEHQIPIIARAPDLVDKLADHIAAFSIAAIGARRRQLEGESAALLETPIREAARVKGRSRKPLRSGPSSQPGAKGGDEPGPALASLPPRRQVCAFREGAVFRL